VAEIVWDQIEALRLRGPVAGVVNDHGVFGFDAFESIASTSFQRRWSRFPGESFDDGKNIVLRGVCVEQFDNFNTLEVAHLRLLATHLVAEATRVRDRVLQ